MRGRRRPFTRWPTRAEVEAAVERTALELTAGAIESGRVVASGSVRAFFDGGDYVVVTPERRVVLPASLDAARRFIREAS